MVDLLVIDDQEAWQELVVESIEGFYSYEVVKGKKEALQRIKAGDYKAVCMNYEFYTIHQGRKLLILLEQEHPDVPVVLITGNFAGATSKIKSHYSNVKDVVMKGGNGGNDEYKDNFKKDLLDTLISCISEHGGGSQPATVDPASEPRTCHSVSGKEAITWLHISDLHIRASNYDADIVLKEMIDDIGEQCTTLEPDFIAVTGDVAQSGAEAEYERAKVFFDDLLSATGVDKKHLFLVPGNHDVSWRLINRTWAAGCVATTKTIDDIDSKLNTPEDLEFILSKFEHYERFIGDYMKDSSGKQIRPLDHNNLSFSETINIAGVFISLVGLNSAWMSAYNWKEGKELKEADDDRNLIIGRKQLLDALEKAEERVEDQHPHITIVLMHHPTENLKDVDRQVVESLLAERCDFILHGHIHKRGIVASKMPAGETMVFAASAAYRKRDQSPEYNGYNFVQLDLDKGIGTTYMRCYSPNQSGFWTEDTASLKNTPGGRYTFSLPEVLRK